MDTNFFFYLIIVKSSTNFIHSPIFLIIITKQKGAFVESISGVNVLVQPKSPFFPLKSMEIKAKTNNFIILTAIIAFQLIKIHV